MCVRDAEGAGQRIARALVLILAADRRGSPASLRINTSAYSPAASLGSERLDQIR